MHSKLNDYQMSLNALLIWCCWIGGAVLLAGGALGLVNTNDSLLGVGLVAFGHLRSVAAMLADLEHRERAAFDLGRESVRSVR